MASSAAPAVLSARRLYIASSSKTHAATAYSALLRSSIMPAPAPAIPAPSFQSIRCAVTASRTSASVSTNKPEKSTSFVAFTAIIMCSGYAAKNAALHLAARAPLCRAIDAQAAAKHAARAVICTALYSAAPRLMLPSACPSFTQPPSSSVCKSG